MMQVERIDAGRFVCEAYYAAKRALLRLDYKTLREYHSAFGCRCLILTHMSAEVLEHRDAVEDECASDGLAVDRGAGARGAVSCRTRRYACVREGLSMGRIRWAVLALAWVVIATAACGSNNNKATNTAATAARAAQTAGTTSATTASATAAATATPTAAATAAPATGDITVYAALTQANGDALAKAFQTANPGVHVTMVTGGTGALVTRINTEKSAGGVHADVIFLADPTAMDTLASSGVLSTYLPAAAATLPQGLTGKGWAGVLTFQNVIAYRTGISNPPADWADLTKPALKGKVVIADPSYSGTTFGMAAELSSTLGWTYFQNLKANGAKVEQSTNTVGTDIAQGMDDAGITLDSVVRDLVKQGAPIKIVWPASGTVPVPAPVGLSADAKNAAAGKAFIDWLLTPAGQQEIVSLGYVPAVPGTEAANLIPAGTKQLSVDWATFGTQKDAILKQFHVIFPG